MINTKKAFDSAWEKKYYQLIEQMVEQKAGYEEKIIILNRKIKNLQGEVDNLHEQIVELGDQIGIRTVEDDEDE